MTFLQQIQCLLERTYSRAGINLEECLISASRFRELSLLAGDDSNSLSEAGRTFLRFRDGHLYLAIYYDPGVIRTLERHHPLRELGPDNIRELIVFLEEIDHAIHAALLFKKRRGLSPNEDDLCNLELQARIDTYLALELIAGKLRRKRPMTRQIREWIYRHLFCRNNHIPDNPCLAMRYREANRLGGRLVQYLNTLKGKERLALIRRFGLMQFNKKRRFIESLTMQAA